MIRKSAHWPGSWNALTNNSYNISIIFCSQLLDTPEGFMAEWVGYWITWPLISLTTLHRVHGEAVE